VLNKREPERLESVYLRLESGLANEIRSVLSHVNNGIPFLLLDRVRFIRKAEKMRHISEDVLCEICRSLEIHFLNKDEEFLIKREDVHYAS